VARRGGDLAAVAADVGAIAAVGGGEGRAGFRADVFEGWAEGWDCGSDEDGALLEGRGVEVGYGAVWMGSVVLVSGVLDLVECEKRCLRVKSQSAEKISSSSMVRHMAAPQAILLKPRRREASHFARLVV
jgi:hypothetical protein